MAGSVGLAEAVAPSLSIAGTLACQGVCGCSRPAAYTKCSSCGAGDHLPLTLCQNCDEPLTGRQTRWCSIACGDLWHDPRLAIPGLMEEQAGLCGICALPLGPLQVTVGGWMELNQEIEADHVVPRTLDGTNRRSNIRATHRYCNRHKGALSLADARRRLGVHDDVLINRLVSAWAPPRAWRVIVPPRIGNTPSARREPHPAYSQWPYSGDPHDQGVLNLGV